VRASHCRTQEQIIGVWTRPADLEYLHHVEELAVNVAHNGHGRSDVHHIALFHKKLFRLCAYCLNDRLCQQLLLGEARYALVEVYGGCERSVQVLGESREGRRRLTYTEVRA
jgi:hypothetical protein